MIVQVFDCCNVKIVLYVFCHNFNSELLHTFGLMSWYDVNTDKKRNNHNNNEDSGNMKIKNIKKSDYGIGNNLGFF